MPQVKSAGSFSLWNVCKNILMTTVFSYNFLSPSLNTLKTIRSKAALRCFMNFVTVSTAISAPLSLGKWNSPVEIQQRRCSLIPGPQLLQAGNITVSQVLFQFFCQPHFHHRSHGVNHIPAWKAEPRRQHCPSDRLLIIRVLPVPVIHIPACRPHAASDPQRNEWRCQYSVAGHKAPQHTGIGRVDNGICLQTCNIALQYGYTVPKQDAASILLLYGWYVSQAHNSLFPGFLPQEFILNLQESGRQWPGHTDIHKGTHDPCAGPGALPPCP